MWTIAAGWHMAIGFFLMLGFWVALVAIAVLIVQALFPNAHRSGPGRPVGTKNGQHTLSAPLENESCNESETVRVQDDPLGQRQRTQD